MIAAAADLKSWMETRPIDFRYQLNHLESALTKAGLLSAKR
ncbi:hypothetical protein ACVWZZ_004550 [Bradyrhizobium sp. LM6.10]